MKTEIKLESVRDSMGCYYAYTLLLDDVMVSVGSADDLATAFEMALEALAVERISK